MLETILRLLQSVKHRCNLSANDNDVIPKGKQVADSLLTPEGLAEFLGVPVATLYQWRYRGIGPRAYRVGRHLRYAPEEVDRWLAEQRDT
jgi:excisionase family DNA binding protein